MCPLVCETIYHKNKQTHYAFNISPLISHLIVREHITKLGRLTEPKLLATAHAVADPEDGTLSPDPEEPQIPESTPNPDTSIITT